MFTATFTFAKGGFDDDFHELDQRIAVAARAIPGYMGEETWESESTGLISSVYYWRTLEALQQLIAHPDHLEAKARQARWLRGYHVVIGQVLQSYGDGLIPHPLSATPEHPPNP